MSRTLPLRQQGRGLSGSRSGHGPGRDERAAVWVVELRRGREAAQVRRLPAGDQDLAAGQQRCALCRSRAGHGPGRAERARTRVVQLRRRQVVDIGVLVELAAGDQDLAVGEQGRGVVHATRCHGPGQRERPGARVVQLRRIGYGTSGDSASGDQDPAVGQQCRGVPPSGDRHRPGRGKPLPMRPRRSSRRRVAAGDVAAGAGLGVALGTIVSAAAGAVVPAGAGVPAPTQAPGTSAPARRTTQTLRPVTIDASPPGSCAVGCIDRASIIGLPAGVAMLLFRGIPATFGIFEARRGDFRDPRSVCGR